MKLLVMLQVTQKWSNIPDNYNFPEYMNDTMLWISIFSFYWYYVGITMHMWYYYTYGITMHMWSIGKLIDNFNFF